MTEMTFTTPTSGPALPVYAPSYASAVPYITMQEYLADPNGVDISNLVPSGSPDEQTAALNTLIFQASSWADSIADQVLGATVNVEDALLRIQRDGTVVFSVENTPLVAVNAINWGYAPGIKNVSALTDLSNVWVRRKTITIPIFGLTSLPRSVVSLGNSLSGREVYVAVQYVNGWANTLLASTVSAAATSIPVVDSTGLVAGLDLTLWDGANTETVTVKSTYTYGSTTVPLVSPLQFGHSVSTALPVNQVSVSALPGMIKRACLLLTTCLIKVRGTEALVMGPYGSPPSQSTLIEAGALTDFQVAETLLNTFARVV